MEALRGVSLTVSRGDYLSVTGASGSGKTTLMHILGLLDAPTSGRYLLDGEDVSQLPPEARARLRGQAVGFVFQSFRLLQDLTALENAALPLAFQGVPERVRLARARELLEAVGLAGREGHRPKALSGGQQQRVAIARALATKPSIILADEPTGNLDSKTSQEVLNLMQISSEKYGQTIVMITHNEEIAQLGNRIVHIEDGRIVNGGVV